MKLAIDCRMIGSSGIGTYINELIPFFLERAECVLLGTHDQCSPFLRMENAEFCFCDVKPFSIKEIFNFPKEVSDKINSCQAFYTPYCNIPGGIKVPIFSTIHDVVFFDVPGLTSFLGKIIRKMMYLRAINYSEAIFTVSEFSKERIIHHLKCKKPIHVGYNGISSWILKNDSESKTQISQKSTTILFVGNIKKHKGLSVLLDAFEIVHKKIPELKLTIVGNADNFRSGDEEVLNKLKLANDSIIFTGKISNAELKNQYQSAKLLIQPSFYEGFGIPPLEALFLGTNAIISDIPVFKEIYSKLPVTFFECGNAQDLAKKIEDHLDDEVPKSIPEFYSYKKTANVILSVISNSI